MRRTPLAVLALIALPIVASFSSLSLFLAPVRAASQSEEQPEPGGGLSTDARVGVVTDRQGTALVRPVGGERWTPIQPRTVLMPGDQVRTRKRGANAAEIRLAGGGDVVLGPGALMELTARGVVRLYRGDVEVRPDGKAANTVRLVAPGGFESTVMDTVVLRSDGRRADVLTKAPRWLTGYRSSTTDEWMGSLVAAVDGRDVPLSVGYHKVTVEIRDQIARTTVEQSFVNATDGTLEGVFYFPLPAGASISGFAMWIGDELVEADIVERQKARRIYEDILRRRKDPGLLEWSGGNLFKARVFPIFPHGEKRIRIRYTQVLPLEGSTLRYRYALRSELLRSRPLRELKMNIAVSSTMPIKSVSSATHEVRTRHTTNAASAEFDADDYSPDRDFELAIQLDRSAPLTVVPHRRDDDGYFMLLLSPPDASGGKWQRDLLADGDPLDLLFVADTSGSMDDAARASQAEFIGALLSLLGPKDRFRLMTADVGVRWFDGDSVPATAERIEAALAFLDGRSSLGWSDLDLALAQAKKRAGPKTLVVYVGDGIGTTGDADPNALADRLKRLLAKSPAAYHAVFTASTHERGVLDAIAAAGGGGSVRAAGDDPVTSAFRLLSEATQPAVKNLRIRFEGLRTARVYPQTLPNLAAGTQQVVLGRFLPTPATAGTTQAGTIVLTGTLGGKPVRYSTKLEMKAGDTGNSFIPRLWARQHIDALLAEGRSKVIQEEIVAFSERFGIMTPYTSFLVLENDEDRERYGVTRRVKMRDGERFFADGRDTATTELRRQQMKRARTWRLDLRAKMLRELAGLGKHLHHVALAPGYSGKPRSGVRVSGNLRSSWRFEAGQKAGADSSRLYTYSLGKAVAHNAAAPVGGFDDASAVDAAEELEEDLADQDEAAGPDAPILEREGLMRLVKSSEKKKEISGRDAGRFSQGFRQGGGRNRRDLDILAYDARRNRRPQTPQFSSYRFPSIAPPPKPTPAGKVAPDWSPEIVALLKSLDRRPDLDRATTAIEVHQRGVSLHPLNGHVTSFERSHGLFFRGAVDAPRGGWWVRYMGRGSEPHDRWVAGETRGTLALGVRLGRRRPATAADRTARAWPFPLHDMSMTDLSRNYHRYTASLVKRDDGNVVVVLVAPAPSKHEWHLAIDPERSVVIEHWNVSDGKSTARTRFADFVEAGGRWWATQITSFNHENRPVRRLALTVKTLAAATFAAGLEKRTATYGDAIFLGPTDPDLAAAKQAIHEKRGTFADHFRVAIHFVASQQWGRVWTAWRAAEAKVADKPGARWLAATLMAQSRKGVELKGLLNALATDVARTDDVATDFRAVRLLDLASGMLQANEQLALLDALEPAFQRSSGGPEETSFRRLHHLRKRAAFTQRAGQAARARALWRTIAEARPFDIQAVMAHLRGLRNAGLRDEAIARARAAVTGDTKRLDHESYQLYEQLTSLLWERRRLPELLAALEAWIELEPTQETAYQRYLSMLLMHDREKDADAWVAKRLAGPPALPRDETMSAAARAELGAAIGHALGRGWNYWGNRIEEKWLEPLGQLVLRLAKTDDATANLAARIAGDYRFRQTDAAATMRKALLAALTEAGAIEAMSTSQLGRFLGWIPWGKTQVDADAWRLVTDRVRARWETATTKHERETLARYVFQLLDGHGERAEALAFARARLETADDERRPNIVRALLDRLVQESWSKSIEGELFALLPGLRPKSAGDDGRRQIAAGSVRWLADHLYRMRNADLMGPAKEYEKLPRKALKKKSRAARAAVLRALVDRFGTAATAAAESDSPAQSWFEIERLTFAAQLGADLAAVDAEVRELMFSTPTGDALSLERVLRERCAYVIGYCATRRKATPALADNAVELLKSFTAKIDAPQADSPTTPPKKTPGSKTSVGSAIDWRYHLFRLLVALDEPTALGAVLGEWVEPARVESRWRIAYGYLMAEIGRVEVAVTAFEAVARIDELSAAEYATLGDWYLALNDDARRERALIARYAVSPEHELNNRLYRDHQRIARHGDNVPEELDPDTLRVLSALLSKASRPASYISQVSRFYNTVKDFRLLESLADGVIGHTPAGIYPFLKRVGSITNNIHEEATADALVARIRERTKDAKQATDRRALDLLTAMVERRAAEVLDAPGPHARRGLDAMKAAFHGEWLPGERVLMASFLASLGRIPQPLFANEQRRQLAALHQLEAPGTFDGLRIATWRYETEWRYRQYDAAIDGIAGALQALRDAHAGVLPIEARDALNKHIQWLSNRRRYRQAETVVNGELRVQEIAGQGHWLRQRLFEIYVGCLRNRGAVSIGTGAELYRAARARMEKSMWEDAVDQIQSTLSQYCSLATAAQKRAGVKTAGRDLERFATERLPELTTRVATDTNPMIGTVAGTLFKLRGPRVALTLLVDALEREPAWLRRAGRGGWRQFSHNLGKWRVETGALGALEPRVLRVMLHELERDLLSLQSQNRTGYQINSSYFWRAKMEDFAALTGRVIEENADSPARVLYAATYFWNGLHLYDRAIAVLLAAEQRGALREDGRHRVVTWLHHQSRYRESLPLLEKLVEARPDRLDYRTLTIRALHESKRDAAAIAFLDATEKLFKSQSRWNENAVASLAHVTLQCGFHERSARYYEEVIPLHQRTHPNRGVGGGTLSAYYGQLARAYSGLGDADKAVDAASAAVVSWGRNQGNRHSALQALRTVIGQIAELDDYVARREASVRESGLDAPVIRKSIGLVYLEKRAPAKAIPQLLQARELQPNDSETHQALLRAHDALGQKRAACESLLGSIRAAPMDLTLYETLGRRLEQLGDPAAAERAWTTLVEVKPNEADSHRRLALHRERQKRFAQAVVHWRQVVRIRSEEPAGWLKLAAAQLHAGRPSSARETLGHVLGTEWDRRFGDVKGKAARMLSGMNN